MAQAVKTDKGADPTPLIVTLSQPEYDIATSDDFAKELEPACTAATAIVDMSGVTYMDSTCLSKLAAMRMQRVERGLPIARIVIATHSVRHLFSIVRFDEVWPLYDTLEDALGGDAPEPEADAAAS
jgi:anti-anti-sigma factor